MLEKQQPGNQASAGRSPNVATQTEITQLTREHGPRIFERLFELADQGSDAGALQPLRVLLDRGYGRTAQSIRLSGLDQPVKPPPDLSDWTEEELRQAIAEAEAGAGRTPPSDGHAGREAGRASPESPD
jgi:hypothetical protein